MYNISDVEDWRFGKTSKQRKRGNMHERPNNEDDKYDDDDDEYLPRLC